MADDNNKTSLQKATDTLKSAVDTNKSTNVAAACKAVEENRTEYFSSDSSNQSDSSDSENQ